jgi:hypothetical protein
MEGYLWDFERLALRYSMAEVQAALAEWRITPGARFFPRPDEIAAEIERSREVGRDARMAEVKAVRRAREIAAFWAWAQGWMADTGNDEEELLRRYPSYQGTKPAALFPCGTIQDGTNVIPIAARDRKPATGNIDDAA